VFCPICGPRSLCNFTFFLELERPPAYDGKTALTIAPKERRVFVLPAVELGTAEMLETVVALEYKVEQKEDG
jgi:hypothetical protein